MTAPIAIEPFKQSDLQAVVDLSLRAWDPVFPLMEKETPSYVYGAFYPDGWRVRQAADISAMCQDKDVSVWLARAGGDLAGFAALRVHEEDSMGEVYAIAVEPAFQRRGVGAKLLDFAMQRMRERGLSMAMIETGSDAGHAPARAAYEDAGFELLPVARYFKKLK
ncbi:MAG: GNAT family N-acetyltransferase [Pseudomonadota bacterium]